LCKFVFRAGEADLESFGFAEPALVFGIGDASFEVSRISGSRVRWLGSGHSAIAMRNGHKSPDPPGRFTDDEPVILFIGVATALTILVGSIDQQPVTGTS
jgi:hypothetical protein